MVRKKYNNGVRRKSHKCSEQTKKKIAIALMGNKNPLGCKRSEQHKKQMIANIIKANLGRKQSEEHKKKTSVFMTGNKYGLGYKQSIKTRKKISLSLIGNKHTLGIKLSEDHKEKLREWNIKRISTQKFNGMPVMPTIGKNEMYILDAIEIFKKIKLIRQFCVAGYFVDGYDDKNNVVYEVDEGYHLNKRGQVEKDNLRQKKIEERLNCNFVRIID